MEELNRLVEVAEILLGPQGCPWDREQTFFTLQPYLLEEVHELIEAIDKSDPVKIKEELGDVLYALIFIAKLGEKEASFSLKEAIQEVCNKLIRRHPHVFGNLKVDSMQEIAANWEEIKKKEGKKGTFDEIPPNLPTLPRAQKLITRLKKAEEIEEDGADAASEEELGDKLWELIRLADRSGLDAESALRRKCQRVEEKHRR